MTEANAGHERTIRRLEPYPAAAPEVGSWLGTMQTLRRGLLNTLGRIEKAGWGNDFLDWRGPAGDDNSVGSLLYHISVVELGWLYFDMLPATAPGDLKDLLPVPGWDEHERLTHVPGKTISEHKELLAEARHRFLELVAPMSLEDWRTLRSPEGEDYSVTPEWIVFHLVEHEAGHLYEIHRMVRKWRAQKPRWFPARAVARFQPQPFGSFGRAWPADRVAARP